MKLKLCLYLPTGWHGAYLLPGNEDNAAGRSIGSEKPC